MAIVRSKFSVLPRRAKLSGLPTESTFLASQTVATFQSLALATILVTVTKPEGMAPWSHGHARLSEISIEEHFGQCRAQSCNAQLTMRGFLQASALLSLRAGQALSEKQERPSERGMSEAKLTHEEPLGALGWEVLRFIVEVVDGKQQAIS